MVIVVFLVLFGFVVGRQRRRPIPEVEVNVIIVIFFLLFFLVFDFVTTILILVLTDGDFYVVIIRLGGRLRC